MGVSVGGTVQIWNVCAEFEGKEWSQGVGSLIYVIEHILVEL